MGISGGFAAMAGMSAVSAYGSANAQKTQAEYTRSQFKANSRIASAQAETAKAEGDIAASHMAEQTKMNVAHQRVASATSGNDVNTGSALNLQNDTRWQGDQNEITIRNNAWRAAWGYNVQASSYNTSAEFAGIAGENEYNNTLLTGGAKAAGYGFQSYGAYGNNNGKKG